MLKMKETKSIFPVCHNLIDAVIFDNDNKTCIEKNCKDHGTFRDDNINIKSIPKNMIYTGNTPFIKAALSASDIFFFPSIHETQGLAIVEAAANSRPIVSRDLPVFKEWLTHGCDCVMGTCVNDFAAIIQTLIEDEDFAVRLGREARRSAVKNHDINRTSRSLAGIYEELLGYHNHSCENA
jgi:glycosyltransferase involved in cell wall biosynthesis